MNRSAIAIAALATLNAALLGYIAFRASPTSEYASDEERTSLSFDAKSVPSPVPASDFSAAFASDDYAALLVRLHQTGFPDRIAREVVRARIREDYQERFRVIAPEAESDETWWRYGRNHRDFMLTKDQLVAIDALARETAETEDRIVGPSCQPEPDIRLGFLPEQKRKQIERIEKDYLELEASIQQQTFGFHTESDTAKMRLLYEERKRDILAVMTPEEREIYEMRTSDIAAELRREGSWLGLTEAEFRQIYALRSKIAALHESSDPFAQQEAPGISTEERAREEKALNDQIFALVGSERWQNAHKQQDRDYQILVLATRRFDLPSDTPDRVYALREEVDKTISALDANTTLSADGRAKALVDLAARIRSQVEGHLGTEAAEAYLQTNMRWLKTLAQGQEVILFADRWETVESLNR